MVGGAGERVREVKGGRGGGREGEGAVQQKIFTDLCMYL